MNIFVSIDSQVMRGEIQSVVSSGLPMNWVLWNHSFSLVTIQLQKVCCHIMLRRCWCPSV